MTWTEWIQEDGRLWRKLVDARQNGTPEEGEAAHSAWVKFLGTMPDFYKYGKD